MRLFIAIRLSDEFRDTLAKSQEYLLRHGVRGRYLSRENLHMTLGFIGELPDPEPVLEVLDSMDVPPFTITLEKPCVFRNNILCAGIAPSDPLERSDVKAVCGAYPLVAGFELGGIEKGDSASLDGVPFQLIRRAAVIHAGSKKGKHDHGHAADDIHEYLGYYGAGPVLEHAEHAEKETYDTCKEKP